MLSIVIQTPTHHVRGKHIYYSTNSIKVLLDLYPLTLCGIQNRRDRNNRPSKKIFETMKNGIFRLRA